MLRGLLAILFLLLLAGRVTLAQDAPAETTRATGTSQSKSRDHENRKSAAGHQTAEDLLRALQGDTPAPEVVTPSSRLGKPVPFAKKQLLPEGTSVVDRVGRLVRQGSDWGFQADGGWTVLVLPNSILESMVAIHNDTEGKTGFIVAGEVTVFHEQDFLLIKHATRSAGDSVPSAMAAPTEPPSSLPADASAEAVLSALESQRPNGRGVAQDHVSLSETASGRPALMEGSLIVRKTGRLLRREGQPFFVFDDATGGIREVRVLPNQALEIMAQAASRDQTGLAFLVSGEMTQFGSDNYLLVRGVTRLMDMGNLRP